VQHSHFEERGCAKHQMQRFGKELSGREFDLSAIVFGKRGARADGATLAKILFHASKNGRVFS